MFNQELRIGRRSALQSEYEMHKNDSDVSKTNLNHCLVSIVTDFIYKTDPKERDHFLSKFYAELPDLTGDDALGLLKN